MERTHDRTTRTDVRDVTGAEGGQRSDIVTADRLPSMRDLVMTQALDAGVDGERARGFALAVHEIATNALRHGTPPVRVSVTSTASVLTIVVRDDGPGFVDPEAGRTPPDLSRMEERGAGMWIARQLSDRLDLLPTKDGFVVRLTLRLPGAGDAGRSAPH